MPVVARDVVNGTELGTGGGGHSRFGNLHRQHLLGIGRADPLAHDVAGRVAGIHPRQQHMDEIERLAQAALGDQLAGEVGKQAPELRG